MYPISFWSPEPNANKLVFLFPKADAIKSGATCIATFLCSVVKEMQSHGYDVVVRTLSLVVFVASIIIRQPSPAKLIRDDDLLHFEEDYLLRIMPRLIVH